MIKRAWLLAGRVTYWVGWPVSFALLFFSRRARVLIVHDNKVLLAKNWMGSGDWHAPGGGLRRGENPAAGASRELREELGLKVPANKLSLLFEKRVITRRRFRYFAHVYVLELKQQPRLRPDSHEISEIGWFGVAEIREKQLGGQILTDMLDAWEYSRRI